MRLLATLALASSFVSSLALADAPKATSLKVLDLEIVDRGGGKFTVRDDAYSLTFPGKPDASVSPQQAPNGQPLEPASVMVATNDDVYGFFMMPIPKELPYDVKVGMDAARDGAFGNVQGKVTKEITTTLGGLTGRKSVGTANFGGKNVTIELTMAWDAGHHTLVSCFTATTAAATTQADKDFIASFTVNPKGKNPPSPPVKKN